MKKCLFSFLILLLLANCVLATVPGAYYIGASEPVAASRIEKSTKKADGSCMSILSLFAFGDASAQSIAGKAGIKEIKFIDKNTFSIFGLFVQETYTIYGN